MSTLVHRRRLIALIGSAAAAWPVGDGVLGQQRANRIPRIGVLWHAGSADEESPYFGAVVAGFKEIGYLEGRSIILEHRFPNEMPERFRALAAELVSLPVDVLISVGSNASPYATNATKSIPIVFIIVADPVGSKLVESLARPNGNATGISDSSADLIGKRLTLLKEVMPGLACLATLANPHAQVTHLYVDLTRSAAAALGVAHQTFEAGSVEQIKPAFDAMMKAGMQALTTNPDGVAFQQRAIIAKLALENRLPLMAFSRETFEAGALMSYGTDYVAICRRAAVYVDKILKGAKPSELPVEGPTTFKCLVNLKTARALGLTIPSSVLVQADEIIE